MAANSKESELYIREIGECLKELRIKKGYKSYETFAMDYDLDRKQYWRVENGANITLKSLVKISQIHKLSMPEFFFKFRKKLQ